MKLLCFSWLVTPAACGCRSLCVYFWAHGSWFGFIGQNNYFEYHTVLEKTAQCVQSDLFQTSWTVLAWSKDCDQFCGCACYYRTYRIFFLMPMVLYNVLTLNKFSMKIQKNSMQYGRRKEMHVLVEWIGKWERTEWSMVNGKVECLKQKKKSRFWSLSPGDLSQNLTPQCFWHITE